MEREDTMTGQAKNKGSSEVSPYELRLSVDLMTKFGCLVRQADGSYDLGPSPGYELAEKVISVSSKERIRWCL